MSSRIGGERKLQNLHKSILRYVMLRGYARDIEQISKDLTINDVGMTTRYVQELIDRRLLKVSSKNNALRITWKADIAMLRRVNILIAILTVILGDASLISGFYFGGPNYPFMIATGLIVGGTLFLALFIWSVIKFRQELSGFEESITAH